MSKKISELRNEIDKLDFELLQLLDKRMEYAICIGKEKLLQKSNIYCPSREQEILQKLKKNTLKYLTHDAIDSIYRAIFALSKKIEKIEKVAFFGSVGSLAYEVVIKRFGSISECLMMQDLFSLFKAVELGEIKYGVIPLENDDGIIKESLDLLIESGVKIIAEVALPLQYSFVSNSRKIQDIKKIYLEEMAFDQCESFLKTYCLDRDKVVFVDSSVIAAKKASSNKNTAAICSDTIAKLYNIPIVFESIQGKKKSMRFAIISNFIGQRTSRNKTSVFITMANERKIDILLRLLEDIKRHGIDVIKIEEKKCDVNIGFYIDFEGYFEDENLQNFFKKRLRELKLLGSYPREL